MRINENNISLLSELPFIDDVKNRGGNIYSVGGSVRDSFLNKESKDLDIVVTGIPMDDLIRIMSKYGRVDLVGKSFGVLKFRKNGSSEEIDVAIPRREVANGAGGHKGFDINASHDIPLNVDLGRRDFTLNAIARDINGKVVDPYGGIEDIKNKTIKVVNPQAFADDPLRMLRAVQFASRFGFSIDPRTMELIRRNASKIKQISPERILIELKKIVDKGDMEVGSNLLTETGLLKEIFGEDAQVAHGVNWDNVHTLGEFIYLLTISNHENPALFYKNNLKGDIATYNEIKALEMGMKKIDSGLPKNRIIAHNMYLVSPEALKSELLFGDLHKAAVELLKGIYPRTYKDLVVNGNDLKAMGAQGKQIGDLLKEILVLIYYDKLKNNKADISNYIRNLKK